VSDRSLTIRGVKRILSQKGVNYQRLAFSEETITARHWGASPTFGPPQTYTQVRISGLKEDRSESEWALMSAGLSSAPYPEYSLWSKPPRWRHKH
jgi:hypothetical protein